MAEHIRVILSVPFLAVIIVRRKIRLSPVTTVHGIPHRITVARFLFAPLVQRTMAAHPCRAAGHALHIPTNPLMTVRPKSFTQHVITGRGVLILAITVRVIFQRTAVVKSVAQTLMHTITIQMPTVAMEIAYIGIIKC